MVFLEIVDNGFFIKYKFVKVGSGSGSENLAKRSEADRVRIPSITIKSNVLVPKNIKIFS
jgi:hypothetical protein